MRGATVGIDEAPYHFHEKKDSDPKLGLLI
jgi:hypothetical protein